MPYTVPHLKEFQAIQASLEDLYTKKRQERDQARMLAAWLPETSNPDRKNDIIFIQNICQHVLENKSNYGRLDQQFAGKNYAFEIAPFLKEVMSGAFMFVLSEINNSYKIFTPSSALSDVILNIFKLEDYSALSQKNVHQNLCALHHYLSIMQASKKENEKTWHPAMTDTALMKQLDEAIKRADYKKSSSFGFFQAAASSSSSSSPAEVPASKTSP